MAMQNTMVHLDAQQKSLLQKHASQKGSSMSAEIRNAIDHYLQHPSADELAELDTLSRVAEKEFTYMSNALDAINKKLDIAFAQLDKIQKSKP